MKKQTPSPFRGTSPRAGEERGGSEVDGGVLCEKQILTHLLDNIVVNCFINFSVIVLLFLGKDRFFTTFIHA